MLRVRTRYIAYIHQLGWGHPEKNHFSWSPAAAGHHFLKKKRKAQVEVTTEIIGLAAGVCTSISLLPQLIKLIREKRSEDLSLFYLIVLLLGLGLWVWYGVLRNDLPIIATNSFSFVLNALVIAFGIRYRNN